MIQNDYLSQSLSKTKFASVDLFVENHSQQKEQAPDDSVSCWGIFFGGGKDKIRFNYIAIQNSTLSFEKWKKLYFSEEYKTKWQWSIAREQPYWKIPEKEYSEYLTVAGT